MSEILAVLGGLNLALIAIVLYRTGAKLALDPLGHEVRLGKVQDRILVVETRQADMTRRAAEAERLVLERLDEMRAEQTKILGYMTGLGARVDAEVKERREIAARLDQITAALANVASRFGGIETSLRQVLDGGMAATADEVKA
jgi:hypothetical protein